MLAGGKYTVLLPCACTAGWSNRFCLSVCPSVSQPANAWLITRTKGLNTSIHHLNTDNSRIGVGGNSLCRPRFCHGVSFLVPRHLAMSWMSGNKLDISTRGVRKWHPSWSPFPLLWVAQVSNQHTNWWEREKGARWDGCFNFWWQFTQGLIPGRVLESRESSTHFSGLLGSLILHRKLISVDTDDIAKVANLV